MTDPVDDGESGAMVSAGHVTFVTRPRPANDAALVNER
jgi:hypothetical protein